MRKSSVWFTIYRTSYRGETETLEISTEARHYCTSRWSRDRGVKTEATYLYFIHSLFCTSAAK